ncbi:endonuclease Q family protein [Paenibacillus hodogayensis]|uniref:Endonuclease Q family protein n=1 Tax=Paenibacillus hodogayensis TaxID=279208 RepID=A0ABV5W5Q5_9BACL
MNRYWADLHIHIGRTEKGEPVKISGSRDLTFYNIAKEASDRKGIDIVGIIDCQSPFVQEEIMHYLDKGEMSELEGGGIRYGRTTIMLGSEIEVKDEGLGAAHLLVYLPTLQAMREFTDWLRPHMKNVGLSSQRLYLPARRLQEEAVGRGGMLIPAHIFTPYKSLFGSGARHLADMLDPDRVAAVELGLSADTEMASLLPELDQYSFVTNSDAHSLGKIGREYNELELAAPTFRELQLALGREGGRRIAANYGLNPRLGKYHRTYCGACDSIVDEAQIAAERCLYCGSPKIVRGVMDRIRSIAGRDEARIAEHHPPYKFQVPLEYMPGLGKKKLQTLLERFGTEMNILHRVGLEELREAVGVELAGYIAQARAGTLQLEVGGGGRYGKVSRERS